MNLRKMLIVTTTSLLLVINSISTVFASDTNSNIETAAVSTDLLQDNNAETLSNGLPKLSYNYKIQVIHNDTLPYWKWSEYDKDYISKMGTNLNSSQKDQLLKELAQLNSYGAMWEKQYVTINNFKFYPSVVVGVLDSIGRAIKARYTLLYGSIYSFEYPAAGKSGVLDGEDYITSQTTDEKMIDKMIESDLKSMNVLNSIPFDTKVYNGYRVLNTPFGIRSVDHECDAAGVAEKSSKQILLSTYAHDSIENTFYHELGHAWAYMYLNTYDEYAKLRGQSVVIDGKVWSQNTAENFAEDFRYAMSPYSKVWFKTSYGAPSSSFSDALKSWIMNKQNSSSPINTFTKIDGVQPFWNIIVTNKNSITIEGRQYASFDTAVYRPDWNKVTVNVPVTNNMFKQTYTFDQEGKHTITGAFGQYDIVYKKDLSLSPSPSPSNISSIVSDEDTGILKETTGWKEVNTSEVSERVSSWVFANRNKEGLWTLENMDAFYILVSKGSRGTQQLALSNVTLGSNQTTIDVTNGDEDLILIKVPLSDKNKTIILNGYNGSYHSEQESDKIKIYDPCLYGDGDRIIYPTTGVPIGGMVRTSTGKIYYELKSEDTVLYSKTILLDSSNPHWNLFTDWFTLPEKHIGNAIISFYEDSNKKVKLSEVQVKMQ